MLPIKTIHGHHCHHGWDNSIAVVERVAPGTTLNFTCHDAAGGHFTRESGVDAVTTMPFERINPVTGPIHVEGATPGDILKITLNDFIPSGFGWTANIFLASASPQVGVIDLDTPGEPLSLVALVHDLQQLVLELPGDVARTDLTSLGVDPYVHDVVTRMHFNVSCRH